MALLIFHVYFLSMHAIDTGYMESHQCLIQQSIDIFSLMPILASILPLGGIPVFNAWLQKRQTYLDKKYGEF